MITAWSYLPNAIHIDRVLASLKANPTQWANAWKSSDVDFWISWRGWGCRTAENLGRDRIWDRLLYPLRPAVIDLISDSAWYAAQHAIAALITWDDCSYMLDSDPGELGILAAFGDPKAILLLPACTVLSK